MDLDSLDKFLVPIFLPNDPLIPQEIIKSLVNHDVIINGVIIGIVSHYASDSRNHGEKLLGLIARSNSDIEYNNPRSNLFRILVANKYIEGILILIQNRETVGHSWTIETRSGELKTVNELISMMNFEDLFSLDSHCLIDWLNYAWRRGEYQRVCSIMKAAPKLRSWNSSCAFELLTSDRLSEEFWSLAKIELEISFERSESNSLEFWFSRVPDMAIFEKEMKSKISNLLTEYSLIDMCLSTSKFKNKIYYVLRDELKLKGLWQQSLQHLGHESENASIVDLDVDSSMEVVDGIKNITPFRLKIFILCAMRANRVDHFDNLTNHICATRVFDAGSFRSMIYSHSFKESLNPKILEIILRKFKSEHKNLYTYYTQNIQSDRSSLPCIEVLVRFWMCNDVEIKEHPVIESYIRNLIQVRDDPEIQKNSIYRLFLSGFIQFNENCDPLLKRVLGIMKKLPGELVDHMTNLRSTDLITRKIAIRELFLWLEDPLSFPPKK